MIPAVPRVTHPDIGVSASLAKPRRFRSFLIINVQTIQPNNGLFLTRTVEVNIQEYRNNEQDGRYVLRIISKTPKTRLEFIRSAWVHSNPCLSVCLFPPTDRSVSSVTHSYHQTRHPRLSQAVDYARGWSLSRATCPNRLRGQEVRGGGRTPHAKKGKRTTTFPNFHRISLPNGRPRRREFWGLRFLQLHGIATTIAMMTMISGRRRVE